LLTSLRWLQRDINKSNIIFYKFEFEFEFEFDFELELELELDDGYSIYLPISGVNANDRILETLLKLSVSLSVQISHLMIEVEP